MRGRGQRLEEVQLLLWRRLPQTLRKRLWLDLPAERRARFWDSRSPVFRALWDSLSRNEQEQIWQGLSDDARETLMWPEGAPRDAWHSFDRHPWKHPWLTAGNLRAFRAFSDSWIDRLQEAVGHLVDDPERRYAFVCNMANNLYMRGSAMKSRPVEITYFPHPQDDLLMSQPEWEEFDGEMTHQVQSFSEARRLGVPFAELPDVQRLDALTGVPSNDELPPTVSVLDRERWRAFFTYLPTIRAISPYSTRLTMQSPYLAMLGGQPYVATQMGGDIWYECSRDDAYGRLQRAAFQRAGAFIVSNPWSPAFARRYGMKNMVYAPFLIDEDKYSPGPAQWRDRWVAATGGDFFVLMTSRQDYRFKGSDVAVRGFARFAAAVPGARLLVAAWGSDQERAMALFREQGIADKVLLLPIVGKKRLVSYLRSADCVLDQLSLGYFGASALEAMSCGRPVVMNLNREQYDALIPEGCAPVCQATDEEGVARQLRRLYDNAGWREQAGEALRNWVLSTHGNRRWSRVYDAILTGSSLGRLPDFAGSPLQEPLAPVESAYHAAERAAAPQFPNYF
jgi:glycosyltransferase involved in cell wall biosynthesis